MPALSVASSNCDRHRPRRRSSHLRCRGRRLPGDRDSCAHATRSAAAATTSGYPDDTRANKHFSCLPGRRIWTQIRFVTGEIDRRGGAQQYGRHAGCRTSAPGRRGSRRSSAARRARIQNQPCSWRIRRGPLASSRAKRIGVSAGVLHQKRAIHIHRRRAHRGPVAVRIQSFEPNSRGRRFEIAIAREARVESEQIGIVPLMKAEGCRLGRECGATNTGSTRS